MAAGIREAYSDLFAVNKEAQNLSTEEAKNKLRTLYAGSKKDDLIGRIARTFTALCEYADFTAIQKPKAETKKEQLGKTESKQEDSIKPVDQNSKVNPSKSNAVSLDSLQYHINIVLPESRDQAVYDAIFKSLRDHLG